MSELKGESADRQENETDDANDGFWDAILEIAGSDYADTPGPYETEKFPDPTSFTFDLYGGLVDNATILSEETLNKIVGQNTMDELGKEAGPSLPGNEDPSSLFAPQIPLETPHPIVFNMANSSELEIAYLKAMLENSVNATYHGPVTPAQSSSMDDDDDEEEDKIKMVEGVILDSQLNVKVEEGFGEEVIPEDSILDNNNSANSLPTDDELITLQTRDLNKRLRNMPKDIKLQIKQRRRLLKNRGYARACRNRRIYSQKYYCEENEQLKQLLELMTTERNMYKTKYEGLKAVIKKAKVERERRKGLEQDVNGF